MTSSRLVIATHNQHKTGEFRDLLDSVFEQILDLTSYPDLPAAIENGQTFEENATIKAVEASKSLTDALVISDDSGLEVDALGGAPGIHSARYSGDDATDATNREKLLDELESVNATERQERTARFRCVIVAARNGEKLAVFDGAVEGHIDTTETGDGGFGYDPLFIPEGHDRSFGELSSEIKQSISHRARALARAREFLIRQDKGLT